MLRHRMKNYFWQFIKTFSVFKFDLNSWLSKPNTEVFQIKMFVLLDEIYKIYKVV